MMINPERFARDTVQLLQTNPAAYRSFGVYWWPVKAILKHYHKRDELYLLGDHEDAAGADAVPRVGLQEMLRLALEEHQRNMLDHLLPQWVSTPAGDPYLIQDPDAEL